jgi:hypothetical protein
MFVALILMVALDDMLNGAMILPYVLLMGGLVTRLPYPPTNLDPSGRMRTTARTIA